MTTEQSRILSKLIDANWEMNNTNNDYSERDQYREEYYNLRKELIDSMGLDKYNEFMNMGRRMFAPAK
jgi:hypothetical protein